MTDVIRFSRKPIPQGPDSVLDALGGLFESYRMV
jgi:hypothetical protein